MIALTVAVAISMAADHPVEFSLVSATAKRVQLAGDLNAWSTLYDLTRAGDRWTKSFQLPDGARIEYKFIVDGQWILDPANPNRAGNGLGGENSVWQGPAYRFYVNDADPAVPLLRSELVVDGRKIVVFAPKASAGLHLDRLAKSNGIRPRLSPRTVTFSYGGEKCADRDRRDGRDGRRACEGVPRDQGSGPHRVLRRCAGEGERLRQAPRDPSRGGQPRKPAGPSRRRLGGDA